MRMPAAVLAIALAGAASAESIHALHAKDAGADFNELRAHVEELAALAEEHVAEVGLAQALEDFRSPPWRRVANGLHVWGVDRDGVSFFDAGHPEMEGVDMSEMSDIDGRSWFRLAWASAGGRGDEIFMIVFPHPETYQAARSLGRCFALDDDRRALCSGGFVDSE